MRGAQSLFNEFVTPVVEDTAKPGHGRNKDLYSQRNTKLCYRYYYYIKVKRLQYHDAITELSKEFDLSDVRLVECLQENRTTLRSVMREALNCRDLNNLYPWLVWD